MSVDFSGFGFFVWYGDVPLHAQSHGESFLALAANRFGADGLYLLDEPEAALSVIGALAFGGDSVERSLAVLRPGGHLVMAVAEEDSELAAKLEAAGMRFSGIAVDPDPVALRQLVALVEHGKLRVHVQETFPFERVADAHRRLDGGHLQGKLVLTV